MPTRSIQPNPNAAAVLAAVEALHRLGDALQVLTLAPPPAAPGPRLVTGREPDQFLTIGQACELFAGVSKRSIYRLAKQHPEVARRIGSRVVYSRGELLRITKGRTA